MKIFEWDLKNKKVLLRIDGNVPLTHNGKIQDDFRLQAILPTLDLLIGKGAQVTLITHLGRPQGHDLRFSTQPIHQWFIDHGHAQIIVRENLRFYAGEKGKDPLFAQELAQGMDYYVNDAWGVMHRDDTSITLLAELFPPEKRSYGLLVEKELKALSVLRCNSKVPYLMIIGGGKSETKLPFLKKLQKMGRPTTLIVLPALSSSIKELYPHQSECVCPVEILAPLDYICAMNDLEGVLLRCDAPNLPQGALPLSVGPRSLALYKSYIQNAQTIFLNGACGLPWRLETMEPFHKILEMVAQAQGYTVVAGGNSVAEAEQCGLLREFDYCSTGGGSTLAYISDCELPGLLALGIKKGEC